MFSLPGSEKRVSSRDEVSPAPPDYKDVHTSAIHDSEADDEALSLLTEADERRLLTRIDWHLMPILCVLYLLAFLDRVNIANANIFGLSSELHLATNNRYNTALVIFFVPYILFEIPSNVLLKRLSPKVWLSGCMFMFGFVTMCQGLVRSYAGLLTTRFFLGLFETGMFPGIFYLIGMWYRRHEAQKRYSAFFSSTTLAGAFGGLLASAIGKMDGLRGYRGWRWIFILEGVLTCLIALLSYFLIPNFPEQASWISEEERAFIKARLAKDQGKSAAERNITVKDVGTVFKDYKVFLGGLMYFGLIVPAYGYAYFAPGIIQSYGYSPVQTQLHSVPPWAAAFGLSMLVAFVSDKLRHRFLCAVFCILISISGFAMVDKIHNNRHAQYGALFLITSGTYSAMPVIVCWFNLNLGGHHRRAVGSAWQIGFGNIGGIIAVFAFLAKDAPYYRTGYSICLAFCCLSILACTAYFLACWSQNRSKDAAAAAASASGTATAHDDLTESEETELGDLAPRYRYLL